MSRKPCQLIKNLVMPSEMVDKLDNLCMQGRYSNINQAIIAATKDLLDNEGVWHA